MMKCKVIFEDKFKVLFLKRKKKRKKRKEKVILSYFCIIYKYIMPL